MTTSPSAQEKAQQTASTAADEGKKVAGTAKEEAQNVAAEAKYQARSLLDDATTQVSEQSRTQRDRLVGTLHSVSQDLDQMASQADGSGVAADLVRQVSQRTRSFGDHLDGREPAELLDDVRQFARRRPGTFLLGALAAGVVAGRVARGAKAAKDGSNASSATTTFPPVQPATGVAPAYDVVEPVAVPPVSPVPPAVSDTPTYSAPGVATPDQEPVVGTWPDTDPLAGGRDLR
jgi:vacuolar-type H+-ATPase subunit H